MFGTITNNDAAIQYGQLKPTPPVQQQKMLSYRKNERMAGSIAVWSSTQHTARTEISQNLAQAERAIKTPPTAEHILSYSSGNHAENMAEEEPFGFSDLLDMINPLQHIPLVNTIYRNTTGDEIKPISKIIGGAVFGGPVGAGAALVNVIVEEETGRDIADNLTGYITGSKQTRLAEASSKYIPDKPEQRLNAAVQSIASNSGGSQSEELPGSVLSFVDMGHGKGMVYEKYTLKDERTAGSMVRTRSGVLIDKPVREKISQVKLSGWGTYND